jgi:uncharacterized membrane protein YtjA (UPF0391 family)
LHPASAIVCGTLVSPTSKLEDIVLELAIAALVVGLIASVLGFTSIAGASFAVARVIAGIFLVLFVLFLLLAWGVGAALF